MPMKIPEGFHTITPTIIFEDAAKAIDFYKQAFGATVDNISRMPGSDKIMHACITIGNSKLFLFDENQQNQMTALGDKNSSVNFYLYFDDADIAQKKALAAGCTEKMPVTDMFWGDRMGAVLDPFGYCWNIATHVREVSEEEMYKGMQEACNKHKAA